MGTEGKINTELLHQCTIGHGQSPLGLVSYRFYDSMDFGLANLATTLLNSSVNPWHVYFMPKSSCNHPHTPWGWCMGYTLTITCASVCVCGGCYACKPQQPICESTNPQHSQINTGQQFLCESSRSSLSVGSRRFCGVGLFTRILAFGDVDRLAHPSGPFLNCMPNSSLFLRAKLVTLILARPWQV